MGLWRTNLISSREALWLASTSRSNPEGDKHGALGKQDLTYLEYRSTRAQETHASATLRVGGSAFSL